MPQSSDQAQVTTKYRRVDDAWQPIEFALEETKFAFDDSSTPFPLAILFQMARHGLRSLHEALEFRNITEDVQAEANSTDDCRKSEANEKHDLFNYMTTYNSSATSFSLASPISSEITLESEACDEEIDSQFTPHDVEVHETDSPGTSSSSDQQTVDSTLSHQGLSKIYLNPPEWPLSDQYEVRIFHHFITKVATFFDFCDRDRHFATVVPQRARICRTLFNAIMALSARHICLTTDLNLPSHVADNYQAECFQTLIPALEDEVALLDETLLATIVILRLLEEMDVSIGVSDAQRHLHGGQSLIRLQEQRSLGSGLRQASFWACLRQEIYISVTRQRPMQSNLDHYGGGFSPSHIMITDDYSWSNYATLYCAKAARYSFGNEPRSRFLEVWEAMDQWRKYKPASFEPFYYSESCERRDSGDNNAVSSFPVINYIADCHVMAAQYLTLGHILLITHDTSMPKVGLSSRLRRELMEEQVKRDVRILCGVALSNLETGAAILIACMAINLCGDIFIDKTEQKELHAMLVFTEAQHGWPTRIIQEQLQHSWSLCR